MPPRDQVRLLKAIHYKCKLLHFRRRPAVLLSRHLERSSFRGTYSLLGKPRDGAGSGSFGEAGAAVASFRTRAWRGRVRV